MELHGLDTEKAVFFYEQDFYVLSNFSSFSVIWKELLFPTSEHVYHWEKFDGNQDIQNLILNARSAHEAFSFAQLKIYSRRKDWDGVKVEIMYQILLEKVNQHSYVKRKLLATGDRMLIENSWRDDYWGWGNNCSGRNELGKLWMRIREEIRDKERNNSVIDIPT